MLETGAGDTSSIYSKGIAQGFVVFNSSVLFLGSVYVFLHSISAVAKTAHEGEVLGKQWSTLWVPMRVGVGFAVLLPLSSGYSLIQVVVMWFTLQGVGLADNLYEKMVGTLVDQKNLTENMVGKPPSTLPLLMAVHKAVACNIYAQQELESFRNQINAESTADKRGVWSNSTQDRNRPLIGKINSAKFTYKKISNSRHTKYQFGDIKTVDSAGFGSESCGLFVFKNSLGDSDAYLSPRERDYQEYFDKKLSLIIKWTNDEFTPWALKVPEGGEAAANHNAAVEKKIFESAEKFDLELETKLSTLRDQYKGGEEAAEWLEFIEDQRKDGWISGGSIYFELTKLNDRATKIAQTGVKGSSYDQMKGKHMGPFSSNVDIKMREVDEQMKSWTLKSGVSGASSFSSGESKVVNCTGEGVDSRACLNGIFQESADSLMTQVDGLFSISRFQSNEHAERLTFLEKASSPILMAAALGHTLMTAGDIVLVAGIASAVLSTNVVSAAGGGVGIWMMIAPMVTIVFVALIFFGATLAFYVPMVPYLIWLGGIISWLVTVAEAMIIAPIWAISFLSPEGEGFTGEKAKQGWLLVLSVFLRPSLMLFGLFFAAAISFAIFAFINATFGTVYQNMFWDTHYSVLYWMLGFIAQIAIFTIITITTLNTIYGLIHIIPDRVLRWIGGGDAPLGDMGAEQASKQAFGAVIGSGSGAAQSGLGGGGGKDKGPSDDDILKKAEGIAKKAGGGEEGGGESAGGNTPPPEPNAPESKTK